MWGGAIRGICYSTRLCSVAPLSVAVAVAAAVAIAVAVAVADAVAVAIKCRATHLERFADQRLARYINFCSWHLLLASVVVVELLCNVLFTNGCTNWLLALDPTNIVVSGGLGF